MATLNADRTKKDGAPPIRLLLVALLIFLAALAVIASIYVLNPRVRDEILKGLTNTLLQLAVLGIIGVYVKYLFDKHQEDRKQEEAKKEQDRRQFEAAMDQERLRREAMSSLRKRMLERLTGLYHSIFNLNPA